MEATSEQPVEFTVEQLEIFSTYASLPDSVLVKRIDNLKLLIRLNGAWILKYMDFLKDPSILERELARLIVKKEEDEARIQLIKICIGVGK